VPPRQLFNASCDHQHWGLPVCDTYGILYVRLFCTRSRVQLYFTVCTTVLHACTTILYDCPVKPMHSVVLLGVQLYFTTVPVDVCTATTVPSVCMTILYDCPAVRLHCATSTVDCMIQLYCLLYVD
jgi:hypothetical protein